MCDLLLEADNGDSVIIPVDLSVYDRVDLESFALLAQYWMDDCGDIDDCIAADWYVDGTIDILDLRQLSLSWLGEEAMYVHTPISYWQFDEESGTVAADSIGENDGTLVNFPTDDSQWVDGALSFDGVDDYVQITGYKGITGAQSRTCCAWIKTTQSTVGEIMTWGSLDTGAKWSVGIKTNVFSVRVQGGNIFGSTEINDGLWHHVAVTWQPDTDTMLSNAILYVDGAPEIIGSMSDIEINTAASEDVSFGKMQTYNYFQGQIDDVRIYDKVLGPNEIFRLYTDTR